MRNSILWIHRWVGLTAGLFFGIASLTGAVLVYEPEIDALINAGAYPVTPGDLGIEAVEATVAATVPGAAWRSLRWPQPREPVYRIDLEVDGTARRLLVDPGSARVIEPTRVRIPLTLAFRRMHTSLFAGPPGGRLVTYACVVALLGMVSGLILWWPGLRGLPGAFRVRARRTFYILNFDLHQVLGAVALPALFVITLSGVLLPFPRLGGALAHALHLQRPAAEDPWPAPPALHMASNGAPAPSVVMAGVRSRVPDRVPVSLEYPRDGAEPIVAALREPVASAAPADVRVLVDAGSGAVLQVRDPRELTPAVRLARSGWMRIHVAGVGGQPVRALYVLVCLIGGLLVPTGALLWWLTRTRKAESARVRARRT